ncbi:sigma-70 family RNA polymerase sigma factor [Ralstonia sp. SET104]|uniref:sigma-70 family RNA polymerase sigma factor n=1 Tax=Ralstonia sp. SET104 TaxID=2448774 RepID=UPI0026D49CFA|nr:sigma-70 family RNA polymerase sigma factor [Ralstonia sp. SET104]
MRDMNEAHGAAGPDGHSSDAATSRADGTTDWSVAMAQAQGGNREAYRRLLEEITPYLRAFAARYFRNRSDVEDTVQDVLLTIHAVRHTYDPARPFGPWLVAIAKRRIIDCLRRQGRIGLHETALDAELETFFADESNLSERTVDARVVHEAVARLPKGQREAVRMLKLEEMSLKEAAAASGMSVAALKVATHRALKTLRKLLESRDSKP